MPIDREQRRQHALRVKPWRYSTGAKTPEGKARSKQNALKHGMRSREFIEMMREVKGLADKAEEMIDIAKPCILSINSS